MDNNNDKWLTSACATPKTTAFLKQCSSMFNRLVDQLPSQLLLQHGLVGRSCGYLTCFIFFHIRFCAELYESERFWWSRYL